MLTSRDYIEKTSWIPFAASQSNNSVAIAGSYSLIVTNLWDIQNQATYISIQSINCWAFFFDNGNQQAGLMHRGGHYVDMSAVGSNAFGATVGATLGNQNNIIPFSDGNNILAPEQLYRLTSHNNFTVRLEWHVLPEYGINSLDAFAYQPNTNYQADWNVEIRGWLGFTNK